jgi:membrane protein
MLEVEFVDRSVALAGKAFVSFFPLVIVVAAFLPASIRDSIFTTLTHRLGVQGGALAISKQAFASSDQIRKATGVLGLLLTIFYATSFTTGLQRMYLKVWRRPSGSAAGEYIRGPVWFFVLLADMALLGALRGVLGDGGPQIVVFVVVSLVMTSAVWWFSARLMLMGQVRWRVLLPSGVLTAITTGLYAVSASIWMPGVVTRNHDQFGIFGIALALVTWFSGTAICILIGVCAGAVFATDTGRVGQLIRGSEGSVLEDGAAPSLPPPERGPRVRDAFRLTELDEIGSPQSG